MIEDQEAPVARVVPLGAKHLKDKSGKLSPNLKLGYEHRPPRVRGHWTRNTQRLAEVECLISYRKMMTACHGQIFDITAEQYLTAIMPELLLEAHLPRRPLHRANPILWANAVLPDLLDRHDHEWFDALEDEFERAHRRPRPLRADAIAKLLQVTWDERQECGLTTIGAVDMTKRQQRAERKKADAEYQRARRERSGAKPRSEALTVRKPWEEAGVSKATWYRQQKQSETNSSASCGRLETTDETDSSASSEASKSARETDSSAALYITRLPTKLSQPSIRPGKHQPQCDGRQTIGPAGEANSLSGASTPVAISACAPIAPAHPPDTIQFSFLAPPQARDELRLACEAWTAGPMPEAIRVAYIAAKRRRAFRQEDVALAIQISRPQLANALQGTFNLSPPAIERLKAWLLADDASLPPPARCDWDRPMRPPHHRRGGKRPVDRERQLGIRLFAVIGGGGQAGALVLAEAVTVKAA